MNKEKQKKGVHWYQEHYKINPLDWRNLSNTVIGEDKVIKKLQDYIEEGGFCLLHGIPGTGKTTIIEFLKNELRKNYRCVNINCDEIAGKRDIDFKKNYLKKNKNLIDYISKREIVIFLDEMNASPKYFIQQIKGALDKKIVHSIVGVQVSKEMVNCPETFKERITDDEAFIQTQKLDDEDLVKIFEKRLGEEKIKDIIERRALRSIIQKGRGNVRDSLKLANKGCKNTLKFPITLEVVSKIKVKENKSKEIKEQQPIEVKRDSIKFKALSPFQQAIANVLILDSHTCNDLATKLEKSYNSVSKQLSMLSKKGLIKTIDEKPKKYDLEEQFKKEMMKE